MKTCENIDCNNKASAKGYCDKHYRRFKKYGSSNIVHKHIKKTCLDDECQEYAIVKGYCDKHYRRFKKTGTSKLIQKTNVCKIAGCQNKHLAKSLCYTHYWMNAKKVNMDNKAITLIQNHNGFCDICGTDKSGYSGRNMCIDHDHKTGIVRGILCQKCNVGLGNFQDNPNLLLSAVKYLQNKNV